MKRILLLALSLAVLSCGPKKAELLPAENFSGSVDGKPVSLYTLKGGKLIAQYTNFGGRGVTLFAPDRHGNMRNIVVGHATLDEYVHPVGERFLGACVGPVANRIGGAHFCIGEELFSTPANDNEVNTLHGGFIGLDNVVWDVEAVTDSSLTLHFLHPDGMEGYPGNLDITMTYSLTSKDELRVDYRATTDAPTPVNISHHPFFNLRGEGEGTVEDYAMCINADGYLPIDSLSIPLGYIAPVEGTPFDFRTPHPIGERIGEDDVQLRNARGYDHCWCLNKTAPGALESACTVYDPVSGRCVEVITDQIGLQFYSGNFFDGNTIGSNGSKQEFRSSFVLETQQFPDAPNQPAFPSILLLPGQTYTHTALYRFSAR